MRCFSGVRRLASGAGDHDEAALRSPSAFVVRVMVMRTLVAVLACSLLAIACAPVTPPAARTASSARPDSIATALASATPERAPLGDGRDAATPAAGSGDEASDIGMPEELQAAYVRLAAGAAGVQRTNFTGRLEHWPVTGRVSSPFGPRWGGFHNGLDIAAPMYTPVRAVATGQVVTVGKPTLVYGDTATIVVIAHDRGFATLYAHLNDERPPIVRIGEQVAAGQVIAYIGSTGWSTGPHVHFMTIVDGRATDPRQYLP